MAETLIAAVSVISIFTLLYNLVYPLLGNYKASDNYEDLDSKYVAFYIKEMIETDKDSIVGGIAMPTNLDSNYTYQQYVTYLTDENNNRVELKDIDNMSQDYLTHYTYKNELCEALSSEPQSPIDDHTYKNNKYYCNKYIAEANIDDIYITKYKTTDFKNEVKNSKYFDRSFKSYVAYMPSHSAAVGKDNLYRVIVKIRHTGVTKSKKTYYSYASIEVNR